MPKFDEKELDEFIEKQLAPPVRQPANRRVIVDKLLNTARRVKAGREAGARGR